MAFLKKIKTVDGIMSTFSKTISELKEVEQENADLAKQKRIDAAQLEQEADQAASEANRAKEAAGRLAVLIGE